MPTNKPDIATQNLPVVQAIQRHELTLLRLDDLLRHNVSGDGPICTLAKDLCTRLLDFAIRLTSAKRKILEDVELYCTEENGVLTELPKTEQRLRRKNACDKLVLVPGKLDHATVVAYNVGRYTAEDDKPTVRKAMSKEREGRSSRESSGSHVKVKKSSSSVGETRKVKVVMKATKSDDDVNRNKEESSTKKERTSVYENDVEKDKRFETSL